MEKKFIEDEIFSLTDKEFENAFKEECRDCIKGRVKNSSNTKEYTLASLFNHLTKKHAIGFSNYSNILYLSSGSGVRKWDKVYFNENDELIVESGGVSLCDEVTEFLALNEMNYRIQFKKIEKYAYSEPTGFIANLF